MIPATFADDSDVTISVTGELDHVCPHFVEVDHGRVVITWRAEGHTFELHGLADYLRTFKDARLSHEEITDRIRHDLASAEGLTVLRVETFWNTAGLEVTCSTSPTPAERTRA